MEDLSSFYRECGPHDLTFNEKNDEIVMIEMKRVVASGLIRHRKRTLQGPEIAAWMSDADNDPDETVVLQLLQLVQTTNLSTGQKYIDISRDNFNTVMQKFDLQDLLDYALSGSEVYTSLSAGSRNSPCISSVAHVNDYFTMIHRSNHERQMTQGVYWTVDTTNLYLERVLDHLKTMVGHPVFFSLCTVVAIGFASGVRLREIEYEIAAVECKTKCMVWEVKHFKPADKDYQELSKRTIGNSSALAAMKRANGVVTQILRSCDIHTRPVGALRAKFEQTDKLARLVHCLRQRNETQCGSLDFLVTRVEKQQTALLRQLTQAETETSIAISQDSRTIAEASKRDSSSMKVLAAVTMLFLPGTFIASLFSTSMFNWQTESAGLVLNNRFWIYWAVTLPLTLLSIGAWALWMRIESSYYRGRRISISMPSHDDVEACSVAKPNAKGVASWPLTHTSSLRSGRCS